MQVKAATDEIYVTYLLVSQAAENQLSQKCRHSLVLICGDGVGMGTEAVGKGWEWVQCSQGRAGMGFSFCPHADLYSFSHAQAVSCQIELIG